MNDSVRWAIAIVTALLVIGLIGYARGPAHHHGIYVGVHASGRPTLTG